VETALLAVTSNTGRLLVFPLQQLPHLAKGKGYKLIGLPTEQVATRQEYIVALTCVPADQPLVLACGQRRLTLKPADVIRYTGLRGQRGRKLPRGFQRCERSSTGDSEPAPYKPVPPSQPLPPLLAGTE